MPQANLSRLEFQIMDVLWSRGPSSIRDIQESFPEKRRPAYTTVPTTTQPVMPHLIESGKLTLDDVNEAEKTLRELERKDKGRCFSQTTSGNPRCLPLSLPGWR
jgi:predicted transcriptional regulator